MYGKARTYFKTRNRNWILEKIKNVNSQGPWCYKPLLETKLNKNSFGANIVWVRVNPGLGSLGKTVLNLPWNGLVSPVEGNI